MENLPQTTETRNEPSELEKTQKELLWEQNHAKISNAIIMHLEQYGSMPAKTIIADATGLSRETVYKHLKATAAEPAQSQFENFAIMVQHVTAQVLKAAMRGDLNAARLFLETMKTPKDLSSPIWGGMRKGPQNNYIQINKTIINQQVIQQLKPEQLNRLEQIIAAELDTK